MATRPSIPLLRLDRLPALLVRFMSCRQRLLPLQRTIFTGPSPDTHHMGHQSEVAISALPVQEGSVLPTTGAPGRGK